MMNWVDAAIAVGIFIFIIVGLKRGFLAGLMELVGILVSLSIPLLFYIPAGKLLEELGISEVYAGALGFLIIFFVAISVYYAIAERLYQWIPRQIRVSMVNRVFGLFTGLLKGLVMVIIILAIVVSLPVPFITSEHLEESGFGAPLLDVAAVATSLTSHIFGEAFQHGMGFFTIETGAGESVELRFTVSEPEIDENAEMEMLLLLNKERSERGLPELVMDETLREVARQHSVDMFQRGYFSHIDPEGVTPFDRIRAGGVSFFIAGENLAVAPTVSIAHQGLMDSPGHRENILRPSYRRVGIGAARGGRHGTMFTQNFAD